MFESLTDSPFYKDVVSLGHDYLNAKGQAAAGRMQYQPVVQTPAGATVDAGTRTTTKPESDGKTMIIVAGVAVLLVAVALIVKK